MVADLQRGAAARQPRPGAAPHVLAEAYNSPRVYLQSVYLTGKLTLGPDAYVFGTEIGERRKNVRHEWNVTVLRAHGHEPVLERITGRPFSLGHHALAAEKFIPLAQAFVRFNIYAKRNEIVFSVLVFANEYR